MDIIDIEKLITSFGAAGLTRLEYTQGSERLVLEKGATAAAPSAAPVQGTVLPVLSAAAPAPALTPASETPPAPTAAPEPENEDIVKAPMVGVFYPAASPEAPPYVQVGQRVTKGQTLCILEAMKVMNEIQADWDGTVVSVLAQPEEIVEYGQPLFGIRRG